MNGRTSTSAILLGVALMLFAVTACGGDKDDSKYGGEYLRFSYWTETRDGLEETLTTEVIPTAAGQCRVITTTEQITGSDEVRLGFFGGSFRWLGLYQSEDETGRFDLSSLDALADQALEPQKKYLLPDGGLLQTGERTTVAGVPGIEATFTQTGVVGVTITVVLAEDLSLRQLLPFPLRVRVDYDASAAETGEDGPPLISTYFSGSIELVEFARTPAEEEAP